MKLNLFNFLKKEENEKELRDDSFNFETIRNGFFHITPGNYEKALEVNAVHSCVNLIAGSIARLPMKLYVKTDDGRKRAEEHPLYTITTNPNPDMTPITFFNALVTNLLLYGNAYCEIVKVGKDKKKLNLIPSKYVKIKVDKNANVTYDINISDGNVFRKFIAEPKDILHVVGESIDGIHGLSPIKTLSKTIQFAKILEMYGNAFFENGANPSGTINFPLGVDLDEDIVKRLKTQLKREYTGVQNSGKLIVLEQGAEIKTVQLGNDQSQFLQTKESQIEEIARIFNVPLHMIQKTDKSTSWGSGIEEMGAEFVRDTLEVHMKRIEQAFNKALLSKLDKALGYYFEFNPNAMLRADQERRYKAHEIALRCGFMSPNEIRKLENLPPIEGGDVYCMQSNQPPYAGKDIKMYNENVKGEQNGDTIQSNPNGN